MITGISRIWIRLEMNSHSTNSIGGSDLRSTGASAFHPSQSADHPAMTRKKPIVPTRVVMAIANRSSVESLARLARLTSRTG
jgi:hypothetical protein